MVCNDSAKVFIQKQMSCAQSEDDPLVIQFHNVNVSYPVCSVLQHGLPLSPLAHPSSHWCLQLREVICFTHIVLVCSNLVLLVCLHTYRL